MKDIIEPISLFLDFENIKDEKPSSIIGEGFILPWAMKKPHIEHRIIFELGLFL